MRRRSRLPLAAVLVAAPALAQGPSADWRTLETASFRVHYTAPAEAWTLRAAARLEAIRARVVAEVGFEPRQRVDVLVSDPIARPNGMALPLLSAPRMVLWTSPPGPSSTVGYYRDWAELLILHEDTHLVHLLRPSRNPLQRFAQRLIPLGPIPLRGPRWVHEGYATLVEGKLTGRGRPNGDLRAAILRVKAQAGQLPSYRQMSSDSKSWLGMSMAYLMGSAYLEWLVERCGQESLKHLWARLTARSRRSFDDAFNGVFGDKPALLYDRFTAELTHRAMEAERRRAPARRAGELWQDLQWSTGEPVVSPDGGRLALLLREREKPSRIVVWSTGPNEEAERKWQERVRRQLARDGEDMAPVRSRPLRREPLAELVTASGAEPFWLRWMPDGQGLLFVRFEGDREGFLHPDLFLWHPEGGKVERLTRLADVRDADPGPDGSWAVAVRNRHGYSQLVRVELSSGQITPLTEPSVEVVHAFPRVSRDGSRLAWVRHEGGQWRLVVRELETGDEEELPVPATATVAFPAWSPDGQAVYASVGEGGHIEVVRFASGERETVTRTDGAALAPAPTPDGAGLYFLSLEADGLDLRFLDLAAGVAAGDAPVHAAELAPAVRPEPPPAPATFEEAEVQQGRPYGLGRQELSALLGGAIAPSARAWEVGARMGDVAGRSDLLMLVSLGGAAGPRGGSLAGAWRGWPVDVLAQLFVTEERPSRQPVAVPELGQRLDVKQKGLALAFAWRRVWRAASLSLRGRGMLGRTDLHGEGELDRRVLGLRTAWQGTPSRGCWRFPHAAAVELFDGETGGASWRGWTSFASVGVTRKVHGLSLSWRRHSARDGQHDMDRVVVGGVASSVVPGLARPMRVLVPALPVGTLIGDEYEGQRGSVTVSGLPIFYERHRVWRRGKPRGEWLALVGLQWDLASDPLPVVRLPGLHLTAGVAHILDEPFDGDTRGWLSLSWRP